MTLYRLNFEIATSEDLAHAFQLLDSEGQPVDLAGAALRLSIERSADAVDVLQLTTENGGVEVVDAAAGIFEIFAAADVVGALRPTTYRHELVLTQADRTLRIWDGTLNLHQGIA